MESKCPACNKNFLIENEEKDYNSYYEHISYCW